jgi:hypothetical protein
MNKKKEKECKGNIYKINNKIYCVGEKKSKKCKLGKTKKSKMLKVKLK